jgi:hypothetical protein
MGETTFLTCINEVFNGSSGHVTNGTGQAMDGICDIKSWRVAIWAAMIYFVD